MPMVYPPGIDPNLRFEGDIERIKPQGRLSMFAIVRLVAKHYGLTSEAIIGRSRKRAVTKPRALVVAVANHWGYSYPEIAMHFGRLGHSTFTGAAHRAQTWPDELDAMMRLTTPTPVVPQSAYEMRGRQAIEFYTHRWSAAGSSIGHIARLRSISNETEGDIYRRCYIKNCIAQYFRVIAHPKETAA